MVSSLCHELDRAKHLVAQVTLLSDQALEVSHLRSGLGQAPEALLASILLFV